MLQKKYWQKINIPIHIISTKPKIIHLCLLQITEQINP